MSLFGYIISMFKLRSVILFLILIVLLFKYLLKKFTRDPTLVNFSKKLPGPVDYPLIGNTVGFVWGVKVGFEGVLTKYMLEYGSTVRLWLGTNLAVVLSDPKDIEAALSSPHCLERNRGTEVYDILLGNSVAVAKPVEIWKQKRKAYRPFFNKNRVEKLLPVMNYMISKNIEKMKNFVNGPEINMLDLMNDFTSAMIMKTFFNYETNDGEKMHLDFFRLIKKGFTKLFIKWLCPLKLVDVIMNKIDPMNLSHIKRLLNEFVDKLVNSNSEKSMIHEGMSENEELNSNNFSWSYCEMLRTMQRKLDEENLVYSEIILLMAAGSDTTGSTLAYCLLALAANPDIQERAYGELYQIFGDDERLAVTSDLSKLSYLDQIIKETERLYSLIPFTIRRVDNDLQIGAHIYPPETLVVINITGTHHNPKLYPQPYRFNPDNFAPEAVSKRHRYSFLPFSGGARNCLGQWKEFGTQAVKLMLVAFLRHFSFHTHIKLEDVKPKPGGLLQTSSLGYPISIKWRKS